MGDFTYPHMTARELYDAMLELYLDRANPGSLWGGANVAKKSAGRAIQRCTVPDE